ncbi:MAG: DUF6371 domain-containing protein [Magnetococcus sp. THC-1_WYH]
MKPVEATKQIAQWMGTSLPAEPVARNRQQAKPKVQPLPIPPHTPPPPDVSFSGGKPLVFQHRWDYRTTDGTLVGHVVRFSVPGAPLIPGKKPKKEIKPQVWTQNGWMWASMAVPTPIYGAELLPGNSDPVLIVEGEKTADAGRLLVDGYVVIAWSGAKGGIHKTDWTPLAGRDVVLLPDCDQPGVDTMSALHDEIVGIAGSVRVLPAPDGKPTGWDLADGLDDGTTIDEIAQYLAAEQPPPIDYNLPPVEFEDDMSSSQYNTKPVAPLYVPLGYDHGKFYFLDSGRQILAFSGPGLEQTGNLAQLAPINQWERRVVPGSKESFGKDQARQAAEILISECRAVGVYSPTRVRGIGGWWDAGRAVYHAGDRLIVDGISSPIDCISTRFIYEMATPIATAETPVEKRDAVRFVELCKSLSWERKISGVFLAGWCVVAPICGSLDWRPHVWITSNAGGGKSWIIKNIIRAVLGEIALAVLGSTTEAGLRQELSHDARPIIFDEAESESIRASDTMQAVIQLARQSSSDGSGLIVKGSAGGGSVSFNIRSVFCFSSINTNIIQRADESRITVLSLKENTPAERDVFKTSILPECRNLLTSDFCLSLRRRSIENIGKIRENALVFGDAITLRDGSQRLGDQLGVLLAGAYSLYSDTPITLDAAIQWLDKQDWRSHSGEIDKKDEQRLLDHLLDQTAKIRGDGKEDFEVSFAQLIALATRRNLTPGLERIGINGELNAAAKLGTVGIRAFVGDDGRSMLAVAKNHAQLVKILTNTPWKASWWRSLARIQGSDEKQMRIGGKNTRCVVIPLPD